MAKNAKIIGLTIQKGGTAKSTSVIELSAALTSLNKKVLIIDMDQQCDTTLSSGLVCTNTIHDVFQEKCDIMSAIQHTDYYDLISGDPSMALADVIYSDRDCAFYLADVCDLLKPLYDYILLDNHPSRGVVQNMILIASDYIIVPVFNDENSLRGIGAMDADLRKLREGRQHESHAYIRGIILGRYKPTVQCQNALDIINKFAEKQNPDCFVETVRDSTAVSECKSYHVPAQVFDKKCNASIDFRRIAKKIVRLK